MLDRSSLIFLILLMSSLVLPACSDVEAPTPEAAFSDTGNTLPDGLADVADDATEVVDPGTDATATDGEEAPDGTQVPDTTVDVAPDVAPDIPVDTAPDVVKDTADDVANDVAGDVALSCVPGVAMCAGDTLATCKADGSGWEEEFCPTGTSCKSGACAKNAPDGMVYVPGGTFQMGCATGDTCPADQSPQHTVTVKAFYLDTYEVTVERYQVCVGQNACGLAQWLFANWFNWGKDGRGKQPMNGARWDDANAFCKWSGGRLPTEAEWERAAHGGKVGKFPWGDENPTCSKDQASSASFKTDEIGCNTGLTSPVGTQSAANAYGLYDMAGNVQEWVADWYGPFSADPAVDPQGPGNTGYKVMKGGSFAHPVGELRVSSRVPAGPGEQYSSQGFRCAKSVP